jgi:NADH-quinone oxidoreductase subunit L
MPRTFLVFLCGAAALSGLPLMSGFFSKDEILANAFGSGGFYVVLWLVGVSVAAMTAYYTWRMVAMTFFGPERFDAHHVHPHESPPLMTAPLVILAALSVFGGLLGLPPVLGVTHALDLWLEPVTAPGSKMLFGDHPHHLSHTVEWLLLGLGAAIALGFAHLGFHRYKGGIERDERMATRRPELARFLGAAWTIDAAYQRLVVRPVLILAHLVAVFVDQLAIDGAVNGAGRLAREAAGKVRRTADGSVKTYALWMGAGAACLALVWILGGAA